MKKKKLKIAVLATLLSVVLLFASLTVYAYFSTRVYVYTDSGKEVLHTGMQLQLLFDELSSAVDGETINLPNYTKDTATGNLVYNETVTIDLDAKWGTAQNPYVISETRHLQNLSALQSVGYFDLMYLNSNFNNGDYTEGVANIPYFVICETNGTPTTVGGVDGETIDIKPIGSAEHPFIGVVGGAFVDGTVTIGGDGTTANPGKTSTVSTIHNVKVQTSTNQTDVGLFGYIGFLGEEPTNAEIIAGTKTPQFEGVASSIQNLLLSDVQIVVNKPSLGELISELFGPLWEKYFGAGEHHRYTYTGKTYESGETHPSETHHVGILAGHVSYANIDKISVYYSDNSVYAIDLTGAKVGQDETNNKKDNYYSASGILGMFYNMNCTVENVYGKDSNGNNTTTIAGNCIIKMGTGTSNDEISGGGEGSGTGGGSDFGYGRGYVTASDIFSLYNNVDVNGSSNNELWWEYKAGNTTVTGAVLVLRKGESGSYTYTLADGVTTADISKITSYFICAIDKDGNIEYYAKDGTTLVQEYKLMGYEYKGQTIWKYSKGGDDVWYYGIRVYWDGTKYTLEDKTTEVEVHAPVLNANGKVTSAAYVQKKVKNEDDTYTVWDKFFITSLAEDSTKGYKKDQSYAYDAFTGSLIEIGEFNRKPLTLIEAKGAGGENLCVEWYRDRIASDWLAGIIGGWDEPVATGMYYFFDGVFTVALSSMDDSIRDTWKNDKAPIINLGANNPNAWKPNYALGNQAVLAFLTQVTDNATLDAALNAGKHVYISAKDPSDANKLLTMSLQSGGIGVGALKLDSTVAETLYESYASGNYTDIPMKPTGDMHMSYFHQGKEVEYEIDTLMDIWNPETSKFGNYEVLNIGQTNDLTLGTLKSLYNITGAQIKNDDKSIRYYYFDQEGVSIDAPNGATIPNYKVYNGGYFYYWSYTREGSLLSSTEYYYGVYYQPPVGDAIPIASATEEGARSFDIINVLQTALGGTCAYDSNDDGMLLCSGQIDGHQVVNAPVILVHQSQGGRYDDTPSVQVNSPIFVENVDGSYSAMMSGGVVARELTSTRGYYIYDAASKKYYKYNDNTAYDEPKNVDSEGKETYWTGECLTRYPAYSFANSAGGYKLYAGSNTQTQTVSILWGLIKFDVTIGTEYFLGSDKNAANGTAGILKFNADGSCELRYPVGQSSQYLNYNEGSFIGSYAGDQLYVYIVEGFLDMDWGINTFIPDPDYRDDEGNPFENKTLAADQFVFWPNTTYTGADLAATGYTEDPTYTIKSLVGLNWSSETGHKLGASGYNDLHSKFQMADQAVFGTLLSFGGGTIEWGEDGPPDYGEYSQLVAPIGGNYTEANIPKGCVAFRINSGGRNTVRVIVAVPTTEKYIGGPNGFDLDIMQDYYIGLWQVEAAGQTMSNFSKTSALEIFELPRSYTYEKGKNPINVENSGSDVYKNYVEVMYDGKNYRTYLNGDCVLVAYEFVVNAPTGGGVYILGSVHGNSSASSDTDFPMEIVHFSASGTASAGRDGVMGNQLGAIDFVYDDANATNPTIVTIDKAGATTGIGNGAGEYYSNYYASQSLLYTDLEKQIESSTNYICINQAKISIKRRLRRAKYDSTTETYYYETVLSYYINADTTQSQSILVKNYADNGDTLDPLSSPSTPQDDLT